MMREMRRARQQMTAEQNYAVLYRGTSGVLAVAGDEGYPYTVPMSYVFDGEKIFFHCAKQGHKLDAILREPKASFCVIDKDDVVPEIFSTVYRSVIVFGKMRVLEDEQEIFSALLKLAEKYSPNVAAQKREAEMAGGLPRLYMLELTPEHITGKHSKEFVGE